MIKMIKKKYGHLNSREMMKLYILWLGLAVYEEIHAAL